MPDGPDLRNTRKSETCGVTPILFVAPLLFTFVIEEFPVSRDKNGRFTDCGNPKGRPMTLKYSPEPGIAHSVQRNDFFEVDNAPISKMESVSRFLYERPFTKSWHIMRRQEILAQLLSGIRCALGS